MISALTGEGCRELVYAVMDHLESEQSEVEEVSASAAPGPTNPDAERPIARRARDT
jgi:hypothetical protein